MNCENCGSPIIGRLAYCENIEDCFGVLRGERDETCASLARVESLLAGVGQVAAGLRHALGVIVREVAPENCGFGYERVIKNTAQPALDLTLTQAEKIAAAKEAVVETMVNGFMSFDEEHPTAKALVALHAARKGT